jgi:hypothetical protein
MTNLSPAAQAVWDAFNADEPGAFVDYGDKLAVAILAVVDQKSEYISTESHGKISVIFTDDLLAIAEELEGRND